MHSPATVVSNGSSERLIRGLARFPDEVSWVVTGLSDELLSAGVSVLLELPWQLLEVAAA